MKVSCPNCEKALNAPDDWAGKRVRCPQCKKPMTLPRDDATPPAGSACNLESLGAIETGAQPAVLQRTRKKKMTVKEAEAARAAGQPEDAPATPPDPRLRTCPRCGEKVITDDLFVDLMCRHCGATIPGVEIGTAGKPRYTDGLAGRIKTQVGFYTGFTRAAIYPIPAIQHIALGMGLALLTIAVPLGGVLGFLGASNLNEIAERAEFGWVGIFLTVMFSAEAIFFGSLAYYILIDTIRATTAGSEQPPSLTWNVINLGTALGGYAALLGLYALVTLGLIHLSNPEGGLPTQVSHLAVLARPGNLFVLALMTFGVPMNMIGLSSSHALDGLNPIRIGRSIGRTVGHYTFLFLITLMYLGFYAGIMYAFTSLAGPAIMEAARNGMRTGVVGVGIAVAAWSLLIGLGFYFAYSMGRILGLFARTYREDLDFEL